MDAGSGSRLPVVILEQIRPFASVVILEHVGTESKGFLSQLVRELQKLKMRERAGRAVELIASGISDADLISTQSATSHDDDIDVNSPVELDGFVCQVTAPPSWAKSDTHFLEISLDLVIALRRRRLVAVHCDSGLADAIQRWLDKQPRPPFRRIPPGALNAALLTGEAKGLWLRGTHARRTTKADSKNISGRRLQDALSPLEDSSYAMGSARAELPVGEIFGALSGTVGTTPRKSLVWISRTADFEEFYQIIRDLLILLESTLAAGALVDSPYPWLAVEMRDLANVKGAYEITTLSPDEVPRTPDWPDEAIDAAAVLQNVIFDVKGEASSANFQADVGLDGSNRGKIRCTVVDDDGNTRLTFGFEGQATDWPSVRIVLDALQFTDLITVYYDSGHAISSGSVWSTNIRPSPFPNWKWPDFCGFNICEEKPAGATSQEIHDNIGRPGESSLFSWVVSNYGKSGWLTCDDGTGEIADFIKYDGDGTVTLLHIKAANSSNPKRPVNVTAYEGVTSQATKNLTYLNPSHLLERLVTPAVSRPACWYNGQRIPDRTELIEYLQMRPAHARTQIIIVQPQMTEWQYVRTRKLAEGSVGLMRLRLLETLLNGARGAVTGLGADMFVIGENVSVQ